MKRIISLLLSILMIATMAVTSFAAMVDSGINYTETVETIDNPGTGAASNAWKVLGSDKLGTTFSSPTVAPSFDIGRMFSSGNDYTQVGYPSVAGGTEGRVYGENRLIDEETLAGLDAYLAGAEAQGTIIIPRFAYTWSDCVGCEPDDIEWIITHIEQICEVLNRYPRTVIAVEAGIVGPWGEMHSSKYENRADMNRIIGTWVENLDSNIEILCRTTNHFINYVYADHTGTQAERNALFIADLKAGKNPLLKRFGMYNDGYLGNAWDYGTWGSRTMSREEGIELMKALGSDRPYGGELSYASLDHIQGTVSGGAPAPFYSTSFIEELYATHLSYLSNIDASSHTIVQEMSKITFGRNHTFDGSPDNSAYYGQTLQKFVRDHMGFRFVLREAKNDAVGYAGTPVNFAGKIENTGFGDILFAPISEVILIDSNGNKTVLPIEFDAQKFKSAETTAYYFSFTLPVDAPLGEYEVYLRMGSASYANAKSNSFSVRFANENVWNSFLGANRMGTFTLKAAAACTGAHTYGEYVSNGNADCENDGTKSATCEKCGYKNTVADEGSALGHNYGLYTDDLNATCTEDGTKTAICVRCEKRDTVANEGSAFGHDMVVLEGYDADCENEGLTHVEYCQRCEEAVEQEIIPALGHDHQVVEVIAPTLNSEGYTVYKCSRCEDEYNGDYITFAYGDANLDGQLNIIDMTIIARYIAQKGASGTFDLSACSEVAMDVNCDGVIDQFDLNDLAAAIRA